MTTSVSGGSGGGQPPDRGGRDKRKADCIKQATAKGRTKLNSNIKKPRRSKPTPTTAPRRSTRSNLGTRTVPVPTLSANGGTVGREGACGYFSRTRTWHVANPVQGFIIQKITRAFTVERYVSPGVWAAMDAAAVNGYVRDPGSSVNADCVQYWELWSVRDDGNIGNNGDSFSLCSIIPNAGVIPNTTRGRYTTVGEASFYPALSSAAALGFAVGNAPPAGVLPSRLTDPAGDLASAGIVAAAAPIRYQVDVTWDSTATDPTSVVTVT